MYRALIAVPFWCRHGVWISLMALAEFLGVIDASAGNAIAVGAGLFPSNHTLSGPDPSVFVLGSCQFMFSGTISHIQYLTGSPDPTDEWADPEDLEQPFYFQIWRPDEYDVTVMQLTYQTMIEANLNESYHEYYLEDKPGVQNGDMIGLQKIKDTMPVSYFFHPKSASNMWYSDDYELLDLKVGDVIELEEFGFPYLFSFVATLETTLDPYVGDDLSVTDLKEHSIESQHIVKQNNIIKNYYKDVKDSGDKTSKNITNPKNVNSSMIATNFTSRIDLLNTTFLNLQHNMTSGTIVQSVSSVSPSFDDANSTTSGYSETFKSTVSGTTVSYNTTASATAINTSRDINQSNSTSSDWIVSDQVQDVNVTRSERLDHKDNTTDT